ncbi:AMP-binding protein [Streptomyces sp. GbtcB6]|uniref:AMP-binding protein n=1 Tax=Streptomyces sp. GbtcB6 TaxID=2824751 RepID=UPI001C2F6C66|nr:AMP-binding protein [Streptomyces sp. GbtcB6]
MTTNSLWGGEASPKCLISGLVDMAAAQPDSVAVVDGENEVTYGQLMAWALRIAGILQKRSVREEEPVAVMGRRSAEVVAAMLGITLLGGVYVPLDQEYPVSRLAYMLKDSGARILLCTDSVPCLDADAERIVIPGPHDIVQNPPAVPQPVACRPDLPFYIIYTSGSTGWPKGVAIQHSCLDNMAEWQASHSPRPDLRTAQFAPLNFDVSFQEILGTLRGGGTIVVMPERLRREPAQLLRWLIDNRVERLFLPYVALQMLAVAATAVPDLSRMRLVEVNTAGEQLLITQQIRGLFQRLHGARLVNHYGQSESAMVSSHILPTNVGDWPDLPPIGVPLPGCELLLDEEREDEPDVGELLVAGLPLSLGYLRQPELNKERYVSVAPTAHGHTRAFRTGDLVRFENGVVHYLSRLDSDVKIRGIRVNLLEIEAQLLTLPGIKAATCVVLESASGVRTLRAAVVAADDGPPLDLPAVRDHLRQVLPSASVPLTVNVLADLPRTPSGKTDRDQVALLISEALRARHSASATTRTRLISNDE